jgi:hypothetical protein
MRLTGICFLVLAIGLGIFSWWGMLTATGQRRFDEMDGMYPFFAGVAAGVFLIAGAVLVALRYKR